MCGGKEEEIFLAPSGLSLKSTMEEPRVPVCSKPGPEVWPIQLSLVEMLFHPAGGWLGYRAGV